MDLSILGWNLGWFVMQPSMTDELKNINIKLSTSLIVFLCAQFIYIIFLMPFSE